MYFTEVTLQYLEQEYAQIVKNAQKSTTVHYRLGTDDCVDAADEVLQVGGVKTGGAFGIKYPKTYIQKLDKRYNR